jgi:hypothetical protein
MRPLLPLLLILPHLSIFIWAGVREWRAWKRLDPETRPRFIDYLGRTSGPVDTLSPKRQAERRQAAATQGR